MSDVPWVKVGWSVRVKAKAGESFGIEKDRTELVGQVSQVITEDNNEHWFRLGCLDTSYVVAYSKIASIQILDSSYELDEERVRHSKAGG